MHQSAMNHFSTISRVVLLAVGLFTYASFATAQHLGSSHTDHHSTGPSGSDASVTSEMQDWAKAKLAKSPRHQEWVNVKHGNRTVSALQAFRYATNNPKLKGSFVFYGAAPENKEELARTKTPDHQKASVAYIANQKARDAAWVRWKKILAKL